MLNRANKWLETNWVTPAYAGWLLTILTICFFGAATNTMAGWLYVLSGVGVALLGVSAILPARSIQALTVSRAAILPVTAGTELEIALTIHNPTSQVQTLFQVQDLSPFTRWRTCTERSRSSLSSGSSNPPLTTVEEILPQNEYRWLYRQPTDQRGVYQWGKVAIGSGAPIGLFWCQRYRQAPAIAYVYPQVLKLDRCPLIDGIGSNDRSVDRQYSNRYLEPATEGITRSLRPYRYGDSMRLIHWRTSARYGEFQVRELEIDRGGQDIVIYLDSGANWDAADFEQAVIAACTLYFYTSQSTRLNVKLWTAGTGLISGDKQVLETLAAVQMAEPTAQEMPSIAVICLTSQPQQLETLPPGSRWALWTQAQFTPTSGSLGLTIDPTKSLQKQLNSTNFASERATNSYVQTPLTTQNSQLN
jgi:uncharacterized protein (DUF58 family)